MDPNATLDYMIESIMSGDFQEAKEYLEHLEQWHARGGFLPKDPRSNRNGENQ